MSRKYIDCRDMPSEKGCDLKMSGSPEHLVPAAINHAVTAHGHKDTPELRDEIENALRNEE